MNALRGAVSDIGIEEFMNCILVRHDVRPAMMVQPWDYNENDATGPRTAHILAGIRKHFPDLKQTVSFDGIVVSKRSYTADELDNSTKIGRVLGYLCVDDYDYVHSHASIPSVAIEVIVELVPGGDKEEVQLMANVCRADTTMAKTVAFAAAAEAVLKTDPTVGSIVKRVVANKRVTIPIKHLIDKLAVNTPLNEDEQWAIKNELWNLGFPDEKTPYYKYDLANPVHRGIVIALLTYCKHTPIAAFYPLQEHHAEFVKEKKIMRQWDNELIRVLDATRGVHGGKRGKTRKGRGKA